MQNPCEGGRPFDPEDSYEQYTGGDTLPWFSVDSPKGGQAGKDEKISEVARFLLFFWPLGLKFLQETQGLQLGPQDSDLLAFGEVVLIKIATSSIHTPAWGGHGDRTFDGCRKGKACKR